MNIGRKLPREKCNTLQQRWIDPTDLPRDRSRPLDRLVSSRLSVESDVHTSRGIIPVRLASWLMSNSWLL